MWLAIIALSVFAIASTVESHTLHTGRECPFVMPLRNLTIDKILGTWFVVYQLDTFNTCQVWDISQSPTDSEELILTESRQLYFMDYVGIDHKQSITATVKILSRDLPGKMRIRWPTSWTGSADFTIFDTDYENYIFISQCDRAGFLHRRDVTVLAKTTDFDRKNLKRMFALLYPIYDQGSIKKSSHEKCQVEGYRNWTIDSELFGLLPSNADKAARLHHASLAAYIEDYDTNELEIIGHGIEGPTGSFSKIFDNKENLLK